MMRGRGGKLRPVAMSTPGIADIVGLIKPWGVHLEIEVKAPRGRQLPSQIAHARRISEAGGIYILARSVDEAMRELDQRIAILRGMRAVGAFDPGSGT